jgi:hypothetical protein
MKLVRVARINSEMENGKTRLASVVVQQPDSGLQHIACWTTDFTAYSGSHATVELRCQTDDHLITHCMCWRPAHDCASIHVLYITVRGCSKPQATNSSGSTVEDRVSLLSNRIARASLHKPCCVSEYDRKPRIVLITERLSAYRHNCMPF